MATPDDDTDTQTLPLPPTPPPGGPPADDNEVATIIQNARAQAAVPPAAGADTPIDYGAIGRQLMQQPTLPQVDTTPVKRGWLSLLGEAIGGGQMSGVMSPAQQEMAGLRALGDFGTSLMAGSGYYPGKPMFGGLAEGFQGARRSELGSEQQAAAYLGAQQQYQLEQQKAYLERVKAALPLLQLGARSNIPNTLLGGGPAVPGTAAGSGGPASYESAIGGIEGTGNNPRSSASGTGQFLDSTWQDFASANPDLFKGMTPAQVLAAKSDPGLGAKAITWLAQRNAGVLSDNGVTPSGPSLGIAHYVGAAPAAKIMAAPDNAPVAGFVSPEAVKANPELASMTAGQLKQRYANVPDPGFLKPAGGVQPAAPYQVSTAGTTVPGPPGGSTAPAGTGTAADTPWDLPGGPAASPAAPVTPPAATPAAPTTTADATTSPPAGKLTFEQFQAQHPITIDPATYTVTPPNLTQLQAAQTEAARQLSLARQGLGGDPNKSLSDYNTATTAVITAQREAQAKSLELQQTAQAKAMDTQRQLYADEQQRQQQAELKAQELAQTAAENEKNRQAEVLKAKVAAGYTQQQHQIDAEQQTGSKQLEAMGTQAQKAAAIQPMLRELVPLLKNAPSGAIGQILQTHQDWIPALTAAHIVPANVATTAQLVQGLTDYLALDLKPTATGALRNTEIPMLKGMGPQLGQSTQAQQQALARILNYTQRVKDEYDVATENFGAVDEKTSQPNYKILYKNLDAPMQLDDNGQRVGGGLGPVVPEPPPMVANPTPQQKVTAMRYQKYVANLPSGMPYNTYERQADGSYQRVLKIQP